MVCFLWYTLEKSSEQASAGTRSIQSDPSIKRIGTHGHTGNSGCSPPCYSLEIQPIIQTFLPMGRYLFDDRDLPEVPGGAALYERDVGC